MERRGVKEEAKRWKWKIREAEQVEKWAKVIREKAEAKVEVSRKELTKARADLSAAKEKLAHAKADLAASRKQMTESKASQQAAREELAFVRE